MKATMATTDHITTSQPLLQQGLPDFAAFFASILTAILLLFRAIVKRTKPSNLQPQMQIEKVNIYYFLLIYFVLINSLMNKFCD